MPLVATKARTTDMLWNRTAVRRACQAQALFKLAALTTMLFGCGLDPTQNAAEQDLSPPAIEVMRTFPVLSSGEICGEPVGLRIVEIMTGDTLAIDMDFHDDVALAQYKIDIHHNFDCHSHAKRAAEGLPWQLVAIRDIDDKRRSVTEKLAVPPQVKTGFYHLMIRCLDAAGNEAPYVELNLRLRNATDTLPPTLVLESPFDAAGDTLDFSRKDSLIVVGQLLDNQPLHRMGSASKGRIELSYRDTSGTQYSISQVSAGGGDDSTGMPFDFRVTYRFPSFLPTGAYTVLIEGFDAVNNATRLLLHLNLTE
jgi:Domain of unknown function (DUF4625)